MTHTDASDPTGGDADSTERREVGRRPTDHERARDGATGASRRTPLTTLGARGVVGKGATGKVPTREHGTEIVGTDGPTSAPVSDPSSGTCHRVGVSAVDGVGTESARATLSTTPDADGGTDAELAGSAIDTSTSAASPGELRVTVREAGSGASTPTIEVIRSE